MEADPADTVGMLRQTDSAPPIGSNSSARNGRAGSAIPKMFISIIRTRNGYSGSFPNKEKLSRAGLPVRARITSASSSPPLSAHVTSH